MTFYTALITLILVMDPLGNIPIFLSLLKRYSTREQIWIILRESLFAFIILTTFLFCGRYILHGLHITESALSIAGGIILFIISIRMIFPSKEAETEQDNDPFIVPLAIPLTAGPSALATVMLFASQDPNNMASWFIAVSIASAIFTLIMLSSPILMRVLGQRGLIAIERLMGMILTTVSVQMFMSGIEQHLLR